MTVLSAVQEGVAVVNTRIHLEIAGIGAVHYFVILIVSNWRLYCADSAVAAHRPASLGGGTTMDLGLFHRSCRISADLHRGIHSRHRFHRKPLASRCLKNRDPAMATLFPSAAGHFPEAACRCVVTACHFPPAACRCTAAACHFPSAACRCTPTACHFPLFACRCTSVACQFPLAACYCTKAACHFTRVEDPVFRVEREMFHKRRRFGSRQRAPALRPAGSNNTHYAPDRSFAVGLRGDRCTARKGRIHQKRVRQMAQTIPTTHAAIANPAAMIRTEIAEDFVASVSAPAIAGFAATCRTRSGKSITRSCFSSMSHQVSRVAGIAKAPARLQM